MSGAKLSPPPSIIKDFGVRWIEWINTLFIFVKNPTLATYERHVQIPVALVGASGTLPTPVSVGTAGGLQFASSGAAEYFHFQWEIPDDWDGGSDVYVEVDIVFDSGAMSGTDTIKIDLDYQSAAEGEVIDAALAGTQTSTVTDSGDYAQYEIKHERLTLAYNDPLQPLTAQDHIFGRITRDTTVANDFAGTFVVTEVEIVYNSCRVPTSN